MFFREVFFLTFDNNNDCYLVFFIQNRLISLSRILGPINLYYFFHFENLAGQDYFLEK